MKIEPPPSWSKMTKIDWSSLLIVEHFRTFWDIFYYSSYRARKWKLRGGEGEEEEREEKKKNCIRIQESNDVFPSITVKKWPAWSLHRPEYSVWLKRSPPHHYPVSDSTPGQTQAPRIIWAELKRAGRTRPVLSFTWFKLNPSRFSFSQVTLKDWLSSNTLKPAACQEDMMLGFVHFFSAVHLTVQ